MPAYVIVEIDVHDPDAYEAYKAGAPATIERHGGRYLARGGEVEVLEGDWERRRLVILEFPTMEQARRWHASEDYAPLLDLRQSCATARMLLTEGLP